MTKNKRLSIAYFAPICIFAILLTVGISGFGQIPKCLLNDSIQYFFGYIGPRDTVDSEGKWTVVGETQQIVTVRLTTEDSSYLESLNRRNILAFLKQASTDFAMNLIIYDHFELDTGYLSTLTRDDWAKKQKEVDITYWKKVLRHRSLRF